MMGEGLPGPRRETCLRKFQKSKRRKRGDAAISLSVGRRPFAGLKVKVGFEQATCANLRK